MKLQYLGTAAAEGWPAVFCNCPNCLRAAKLGGREVRTRSQTLLDDHILIDLPPDTYLHKLQWGLDLSACDLILITHAHQDHLYPQELRMHGGAFAHNMTCPEVVVAGGQAVMDEIVYHTHETLEQLGKQGYRFVTLRAWEPVEINGTRLLPLPAEHAHETSDPFVYAIRTKGKNILYLHDTGEPDDELYEALKNEGAVFDFVSFDCCYCTRDFAIGHMGLPNNVKVARRLRQAGVVDDHTVLCVNHFSHNTAVSHDEMAQAAWNEGMLCSYDGMIVEF